ncbi:hypothetical protein [Duganella sp. Root1480D1]|uniref:hypothetical protein n=1 Tax=Duganella sp. Root1480D1 TaxID=1736471 RepID=UPI000A7345C5|nr:hypothetical protein [Duganella sp. Root1480D1]
MVFESPEYAFGQIAAESKTETIKPLELQDRRMIDRLAGVIDEGLDLAEECGWRYAIAYLISESVPSAIIQRLLFGGASVRSPLGILHGRAPEWKGHGQDDSACPVRPPIRCPNVEARSRRIGGK